MKTSNKKKIDEYLEDRTIDEEFIDERINPREIIFKTSDIMSNAYVSIVKNGDRLLKAKEKLLGLKETLINKCQVLDYHELMLWNEAKNTIEVALVTIEASLQRKETRGGHFREDYPSQEDDLNRVLTVKKENLQYTCRYIELTGSDR